MTLRDLDLHQEPELIVLNDLMGVDEASTKPATDALLDSRNRLVTCREILNGQFSDVQLALEERLSRLDQDIRTQESMRKRISKLLAQYRGDQRQMQATRTCQTDGRCRE